MTVFNTI